MSDTALILLAAGSSSRMGSPKQLLRFRGEPLVRHAARTALDAGCLPVIVVLGANEREIQPALDGLAVEIVVNPRWMEGMGTSIRAGLNALGNRAVRGAILALADQPFVTADTLRALTQRHLESGVPIVASRYLDTVGVPVFFQRAVWSLLMEIKPAEGCKGVILRNADDAVLLDCPEAAIDLDTPADYARALQAEAWL